MTTPIRLSSLYMFDVRDVNNNLLRNLTQIAKPAVPCQIVRDGALLPPRFHEYGVTESGYWLSCTYNKLLLAPTIRLECRFFSDAHRHVASRSYLTLVLEFHFCDFGKDGRGISSYTHAGGQLSFTSFGATCSGFGQIPHVEHEFSAAQREIVGLLKEYTNLGPAQEVLLRLHDYCLCDNRDQDFQPVRDVRAHLPGGEKTLLPSITSNKEYQVMGARSLDLRPYCGAPPGNEASFEHTMVPLDCSETFGSIEEACIQLAHSASLADAEVNEALRLWASVEHKARLWQCKTIFVLGVMFQRHQTLGEGDSRFRLPKSLEITITSGAPESLVGGTGHLLDENPGLPHHHAFFRITPSKALRDHILKAGKPQFFNVGLSPHKKSFAIRAQLQTVADLRHAEQWSEVLLNQRHDCVKHYDTTAKADTDHEALDHTLRTAKPWNDEQLQVIDSVTSAKGKMIITLGTAGTGKTTLHKALALYFWCLGYHVLSLALANKDADHVASQLTAEELRREFPSWDLSEFDFMRLFPGSKDIKVDNMTEKQAEVNKVGHEGGGIVPFRELLIALDEEQKVKGTVKEYSVVHTLIRTAEAGGLPAEQDEIAHMDRQWAHLKRMIAAYRLDQRAYWSYHTTSDKLAYTACKGELVRRNRFMVTTTGSVRSSEMIGKPELMKEKMWDGRPVWTVRPEIIGNWFRPTEGVPNKGVIVLIDESTADLEVNLWSGIVCDQWAEAVEGVFLFGDDKQLRPPNRSADRKIQYNCYLKRLDISLPLRLKREGWPCVELKEQYRMAACIADVANRNIYDSQLRNGPVTTRALDQSKPGLRTVLLDILLEHGSESVVNPAKYRLKASDADVRLRWIEVDGHRVKDRAPWAVKEHSEVVLSQIMPQLCKYFKGKGEKTFENFMIITAYNYQADIYKEGIRRFRNGDRSLGPDDVPRVLTIDSSMGKESAMVIFDGSFQYGDQVGFLTEKTRVAVAITRATEVFWIVGGAMRVSGSEDTDKANNLFRQYKVECGRNDRVSHFSTKWQKDRRRREREDQRERDEEQRIREVRAAASPQLPVEDESFD